MSTRAVSSVYFTLDQVLKTLTSAEALRHLETLKVLDLSVERGILSKTDGKFEANVMEGVGKDENVPFIVVEGLDGSGKTFLTNKLMSSYDMVLMQTPPTQFKPFRSFFDAQPEYIRRAFYSLGNYWAAEDVLHSLRPVVMDRFWHSTAAYGVATDLKSDNPQTAPAPPSLPKAFEWPRDLVKPNVVIFLNVSEEERIRRHASRHQFTNTVEEQRIARDVQFRHSIIQFYQSIVGPNFVSVNADGTPDQVLSAVQNAIEHLFPAMKSRRNSS